MGLFRSANGMIEAELTSADLHRALLRISEAGIQLHQIRSVNDLTLRFRLDRNDYSKVKSLSERMGDSLEIKRHLGLYWSINSMKKRPVLLAGLVLLLVLTLFLPSRICFVEVEGNVSVPAGLILEKADECGIRFGASRRQVRSEKMKNALLAAIPQLQWAGINTRGCVAVISVREKTASEGKLAEPTVSRIVASRDAVIVSCTVEQGNGVCKVGQAVKAGELLVSGYTDCGISIRATRSVAEIYGQTSRVLTAITPEEYILRTEELGRQKKYALIIGKKRINFYKDSGILGGTCGKMSTVNYLTLPGGFVLPVALVTEQWIRYNTDSCSLPNDRAEWMLSAFAEDYLLQQMLAGQVLRQEQEFACENGACYLQGQYVCLEMIGREQSEENLENYGKID